MHRRRLNDSPGQATVEFALIVPMVVMSVMSLIGTLALCLSALQLNDLARTVARSAITSPMSAETVSEIEKRHNVRITMHTSGDLISVKVRRDHGIPLLGEWLPRLTVGSSATMMQEPPFVLESTKR